MPIILTSISLNKRPINNLKGLLDSGAGITTVSRKYLSDLGINLNEEAKEFIESTDATGKVTKVPAYRIDLNIDNLIIKQNYLVACSAIDFTRVDLLIGTDILNETVLFLNGKLKSFTIAV